MNNNFSPLEAILGSFMPQRMHMRLNGKGDDYEIEEASLQGVSTWVHENTHFFQSIFTGYGHIAWDTHRQMTSYIMREWLDCGPSLIDGKMRLPLGHHAKISENHLLSSLVTDQTVRDMNKLGQARFWSSIPDIKISDLDMKLVHGPWVANPTVTVNGSPHILQSKEIIEGHAQFVEATFSEKSMGKSREELWNHSDLAKQYWVALDWFLDQCGDLRYGEFPFICDLALQTSWVPVVPTTEEEWQSTNPSWRFVRLTEALKSIGDLSLGGPDEWPETYHAYSASLLEACGFKSLKDIFEERISDLQRKQALLNFENIMLRAMSFRQEMPWCAGNPMADIKLWKSLIDNFPPPIIEFEGRLTGVAFGSERDNAEIMMELQFQALSFQIFGDFSPAAFKEGSIECGFSKFNIPQGCEYQKSRHCSGRYRPSEGPPHPVYKDADNNVHGCSLELLLNSSGLHSVDLDIDHDAKLPSNSEQIKQQVLKIRKQQKEWGR